MSKRRVMFYCQHVLGLGHLMRSAEIVRALAAADYEVCFLNGGELVEGFALPAGVTVINLPPIKADAEFRDIHAANAAQDLDTLKAARTALLLETAARIQPDVLMIELFPFGRRKFVFELHPLLEHVAGTKAKIVCSLRDILVSKRDQARYESQVVACMNRYFDLLLIHADPRFQRLEETFPLVPKIECPIRYTGFVVQPLSTQTPTCAGLGSGPFGSNVPNAKTASEGTCVPKLIASIGGGRVGIELLECTVAASLLLADSLPHQLQIFTGPYLPDEDFAQLQAKASAHSHIQIECFTNNFLTSLAQSDLSLSMAGYNTCMNLLTTGTRALVLPFNGNNNEEQTIRAEKLAALGALDVIRELQPAALAAQIKRALRQPRATAPALDLHGAANTVACLDELLGIHAHAAHGGKR